MWSHHYQLDRTRSNEKIIVLHGWILSRTQVILAYKELNMEEGNSRMRCKDRPQLLLDAEPYISLEKMTIFEQDYQFWLDSKTLSQILNQGFKFRWNVTWAWGIILNFRTWRSHHHSNIPGWLHIVFHGKSWNSLIPRDLKLYFKSLFVP